MSGEEREVGECEVGEDFLWKRKLFKLIQTTPVPATLVDALLAMMPLLIVFGLDREDVEALAADCVDKMCRRLPSLPDGSRIDPEKAATIYAYTLESPRIYDIGSKALRARDRLRGGVISEAVTQCLPFYVLLDASLKHLPSHYHFNGDVYRGVKYCFPSLRLHSEDAFRNYFFEGRKITWYEPKSTSKDRTLMTQPLFCGFQGARTIFNVQVIRGYSIEDFSAFGPGEREVLLPMLTDFIVISRTINMLVSMAHVDDNNSRHHTGHPDLVVLRQVAEEEPGMESLFHKAWHNLGNAGGGTVGDKAYSAKECYAEALRIEPRYHVAWLNLGIAGGGTVGDKAYSAKECYLEALRIEPRYHFAWNNLGNAGGGTVGDKAYSAKECFEQARLLCP